MNQALGWKVRVLIALGLGLVLTLTGVLAVILWQKRNADAEKIEETRHGLEIRAAAIRVVMETFGAPKVPLTGWRAIHQYQYVGMRWVPINIRVAALKATGADFHEFSQNYGSNDSGLDAWGRVLCFACPGPVHKHGWDLWSCGPNGKDDQGTFDDILVGEDVAPETSH